MSRRMEGEGERVIRTMKRVDSKGAAPRSRVPTQPEVTQYVVGGIGTSRDRCECEDDMVLYLSFRYIYIVLSNYADA